MKDENIKEYIETLKEIVGNGGSKGTYGISYNHWKQLLDYITNLQEQLHKASLDIQELTERDIWCPSNCDKLTNLQEENENLREDNFAYHQLMKMQNKREYRSKFLKDFQKEHGKNVFPDYDEIYKRYDNYKTRNELAIEHIEKHQLVYTSQYEEESNFDNHLLEILQGKSDE